MECKGHNKFRSGVCKHKKMHVILTRKIGYSDLSQRRSPSKYKIRNHFGVRTPKYIPDVQLRRKRVRCDNVNMMSSLIPLHGKRR